MKNGLAKNKQKIRHVCKSFCYCYDYYYYYFVVYGICLWCTQPLVQTVSHSGLQL